MTKALKQLRITTQDLKNHGYDISLEQVKDGCSVNFCINCGLTDNSNFDIFLVVDVSHSRMGVLHPMLIQLDKNLTLGHHSLFKSKHFTKSRVQQFFELKMSTAESSANVLPISACVEFTCTCTLVYSLHGCTRVYTGLHGCTLVYTGVHQSIVYTGVHWSTRVYTSLQSTRVYTGLHGCTLVYTGVHWSTRVYTGLHGCTLVYSLHGCTLVYTGVHWSTQVYTGLHGCHNAYFGIINYDQYSMSVVSAVLLCLLFCYVCCCVMSAVVL